MMRMVFLFWVLFLPVVSVAGQPASPFNIPKGLPLIRNFSPKEYRAHPQIWDIVQHPDGPMYFANGDGLLIYNNDWCLIPLSNRSHVRSLGLSEDTTLYIGGDGELGYLSVDASRKTEYISLLPQLPPDQRDFGRVYSTIPLDDRVFFQTRNYLFIWDGQRFATYPFENRLERIFLIRGEIYGHLRVTGIVRWQQDTFVPLAPGNLLADQRVRVLLPWDEHTLLAVTSNDQLFLINNQSVQPFAEGISERSHNIDKAILLGDQHLGLATNVGFIILNREGRQVEKLTIESGLPSADILSCYTDRTGNLWLGTQTGVAQLMTGYPISTLDHRSGVYGVLDEVEQFRGRLFAAGSEGLYLEEMGPNQGSFQRVPMFRDRVWSLFSHGESLLIGYATGLYEWKDDVFQLVGDYGLPADFYASDTQPGLLWVSLDKGLLALRKVDGQWQEIGKLETLDGSIRSVVEYQPGEIWLGSRAKGAYRLTFGLDNTGIPDFEQVSITHFDQSTGLPPGDIEPILVQNELYGFAPQTNAWFRYDTAREVFEKEDMSQRLGLEHFLLRPQRSLDRGRELWLIGQNVTLGKFLAVRAVQSESDQYQVEQFEVPTNLTSFGICLYPSDTNLYLGGLEGILVFDRYQSPPTQEAIQPMITSVHFRQQRLPFLNPSASELAYRKNAAIRVAFSTSVFTPTSEARYQTRLVGFEDEWSEWTFEPYKEYTNLWEGRYEFLVRSTDSYGNITPPTRWSFAITPPWYRQLWIYGAYLLCLISLVYGLVSWRSSQLKRDKERLETTVQQRTAQLAEQRNQLATQSEKLKELDRLKSRFFANISHEFRTPLTLILGILSKHRKRIPSPEMQNDCQVMERNANSLLRLINQLLELSRLEVGSARLTAREQDIVAFVRLRTATFQSWADQKQIRLTFNDKPATADPPMMPVPLYFDPEKMEQILTNLLGNALKYTPEQGWVNTSLSIESTCLVVEVENSGPGITAEALPHIFERFYQASEQAQVEGTGIGLAIVKELTELHRGSVEVESRPYERTTFRIKLRLGSDHLQPEEIAAPVTTDGAAEPVSRADEVPHTAESASLANEDHKQPLLLLVEDNADLRKFIRSQLLDTYEVLEAPDGEAGWQLAEEHLPDLIISDIMMPKLNGIDLCERLKTNEKTNHIPVILLTAKATQQDKLSGLTTGADDYLIKPFDAEELRTRIENLIRTRQQLREKFSSEVLLKPSRVQVPSQQQVFLEKLHALLEEHLDNEQFGVEALSEALGMSRTQTHRKIKAITNKAPSVLIRTYRLQRAVELIRQDVGNFSEIAYQTGFSSLSYFSRCFQDEYGCPPTEFKSQLQGVSTS